MKFYQNIIIWGRINPIFCCSFQNFTMRNVQKILAVYSTLTKMADATYGERRRQRNLRQSGGILI